MKEESLGLEFRVSSLCVVSSPLSVVFVAKDA